MQLKRLVLIAGQLGLAGLFLYSGYAKLRDPWPQFAVSINSFRMVPDNLLEPMARILPWVEVVAGFAVLLPVLARWASLGLTLLLGVFMTAGISAYARGLTVDCGCFGSGNADQIGPKWFAEHGAMVLLGVGVTLGLFLMDRARRPESEPGPAPEAAEGTLAPDVAV